MLSDTWYSRDLQVLTAIAETALRALDVEYLIVRWPERITYRRSDPSTLVEKITSRAREAVGLWPSVEARQTGQRQSGHDQE